MPTSWYYTSNVYILYMIYKHFHSFLWISAETIQFANANQLHETPISQQGEKKRVLLTLQILNLKITESLIHTAG